MATPIRIKRSSVPGKVPTTSDLALGELGLNTFDGRLFTRRDNGLATIVEIGGARGLINEIDGGSAVSVFTSGSYTLINGGSAVSVFTEGSYTIIDGGNV
jgi:hypothetical protein